MRQFTPLLKSINDRLDLPQPTKSRIILEIAADLDDLYQLYLSRGLSEQEAAKKAEEKINLTDDALNELVEIHQSLIRKLLDKISAQAQSRWERVVFVLLLFFIVAISIQGIFSIQFFVQASTWIYPVLGIFLTAILISIPKFYQLYVKKDHRVERLRTGLSLIFGLGVFNLIVGVMGYVMELYLAADNALLFVNHLAYIITTQERGSHQTLTDITTWMIKSSSLIMFTLVATIVIAFICYMLMNKVWKIERAEAAVLLGD
jgi:hypothetical protein